MPPLAGRFIVHADVCAVGSDVLEVKCSAERDCNPLETQLPKRLPSKPASKAETLKAWLISDTGVAVTQPPLEHRFPYFKIRAHRASPRATCFSIHPTATGWEFWYKGRYNAHIQRLPVLFWWSTLGQELCLTSCNRSNRASLIGLCPTKEPRYFLYKPPLPLARTA